MSILKLLLSMVSLLVPMHVTGTEFTVHHGPGGPSDRITRLVAQELPPGYVVVNRPGAQGRIAINHVLSDNGVVIATMNQIFVTNALSGNPGYANSDLDLIGVVAAMPSLLVCNRKHQFAKYSDFVNYQKPLNFGVAGYGSSEHLSTEILLRQHPNDHQIIPYPQGGSTSLTDLLAGNIDCMFANYPLVIGHLTDSRIVPLMSSHRISKEIPTWYNIYKNDFPIQSLLGVVVGKNNNNKQKIQQDISAVFGSSQLKQQTVNIGLFPVLSTSQEAINAALLNNIKTKEFILQNKIKLN